MKRILIMAVTFIIVAAPSIAQVSIDRKVDSLLSIMTLDEKIGQMNQLHPDIHDLETEIRSGKVGSVLSVVGAEWMNRLQKIAVEETRLGIPLLNGRDVIHGFRTIFPIPLGQAASFNPEIVREGAAIAAEEAYYEGINWTFAPMLDISHDARWGRIAESLGEDPLLASRMGVAMVEGFQGTDPENISGIAACAKHFVGYGAAEGGRDYNSTNIPERRLRNLHLRPFKAVADVGVASLMTAFNDNDGIPMTGNTRLIRDILRQEWGWDGMIVSDWESIREMIAHGYCQNEKEAAYKAAIAGVDVEMVSETYIKNLKQMVEDGIIPMSLIDQSVRNILRLKFRLGLFDDPYWHPTDSPSSEKALKAAQKAAEESIILLKNSDATLPLNISEIRTIAVTGPLADAPADQVGTWVFDGDISRSITPIEAIREMYGDKVQIIYDPILNYSREQLPADAKKRIKRLSKADIILYFAGEEAILSGEAHCLSTISLQGGQEELSKMLKETGSQVISIIMAGRPVALKPVLDNSDALLFAFHPGSMAGPALTRTIFGEISPSGKLPVTFPVDEGQIPIYYNHNSTGRPSDGKEILMHDIPLNASQTSLGNKSYYLNSGKDPLFAFGYGLSYTSFEYSGIKLSKTEITPGEDVEVTFTLTNTGKMAGAEIVQCYIQDEFASVARPVRELADFKKIYLQPGESLEVKMQISPSAMSFYDINMNYSMEEGQFRVFVGKDSNAPLAGTFRLIQTHH